MRFGVYIRLVRHHHTIPKYTRQVAEVRKHVLGLSPFPDELTAPSLLSRFLSRPLNTSIVANRNLASSLILASFISGALVCCLPIRFFTFFFFRPLYKSLSSSRGHAESSAHPPEFNFLSPSPQFVIRRSDFGDDYLNWSRLGRNTLMKTHPTGYIHVSKSPSRITGTRIGASLFTDCPRPCRRSDPEYLLHDPRDKSTTACNPFSACFMRTRGRKPGLDFSS